LLPSLPGWTVGSLEIAAGAAAIAAGIYAWRQAGKGKSAQGPSNLSIAATFAFALVSTVSDLPTAVPYFAAASQIAAAGSDPFTRYAWLVAYNLVYVAPLVAMLALRSVLGTKAEPLLGRIRRAVDWSFAKLLPPGLVIAGAALLIDGTLRVAAVLS
jgi:cytochrome c biogenesis protein CcdA